MSKPVGHIPMTRDSDARPSIFVRSTSFVLGLLNVVTWPAAQLLLLLIAAYRRFVSPGLPPRCRFTPSCSEYAEQCLRHHGLVLGVLRAGWRVARCNPMCKGGHDPL